MTPNGVNVDEARLLRIKLGTKQLVQNALGPVAELTVEVAVRHGVELPKHLPDFEPWQVSVNEIYFAHEGLHLKEHRQVLQTDACKVELALILELVDRLEAAFETCGKGALLVKELKLLLLVENELADLQRSCVA